MHYCRTTTKVGLQWSTLCITVGQLLKLGYKEHVMHHCRTTTKVGLQRSTLCITVGQLLKFGHKGARYASL